MRRKIFLVLAAGAMMLAGAAQAGTSSKTTTAPTSSNAGTVAPSKGGTADASGYDPNQVICKETEATIGSRFGGGEICHTRAQWDQTTQDTQQQLSRMQGSAGGGGH